MRKENRIMSKAKSKQSEYGLKNQNAKRSHLKTVDNRDEHGYKVYQISAITSHDQPSSSIEIRSRITKTYEGWQWTSIAWIHGDDYASGSHRTSGGGYDKKSTALYHSLHSAGVVFSQHWAGTGQCEEILQDAMKSLFNCSPSEILIVEF
jgi:hypothetical protein